MISKFFAFLSYGTISLLLFSSCAHKHASIPYYETHPKAPWLNTAAQKFLSAQSAVSALSAKRLMVRVYKDAVPNGKVHHDSYNIHVHIADSLLEKMEETDLLCLLAHECAHVEYNHIEKRNHLSQAVTLSVTVVDAVFPNYGIGYINTLANPLIVNSYSRREEIQADTRGIEYLAHLGIPYTDYVGFLDTVNSISSQEHKGGGLFDTHPHFEKRIENAQTTGAQLILSPAPDFDFTQKFAAFENMLAKKHTIEQRYPFDIGPYGIAKAVRLENGFSEKQIISLFDGHKPDKKRTQSKTEKSYIYTIPQTDYYFEIFFSKATAQPFSVSHFSIEKSGGA